MRVAVVGGGIAGAMLAWRLTDRDRTAQVEVFAGAAARDATGASGGLVRGYEADPAACRLAAESLAELRACRTLRDWSGYREVGSVYLTGPAVDPTGALRILAGALPGSASAVSGAELAARCPLRGLPPDTVGIVERRAGYLSPARLRAAVLGRLVATGTVVHDCDVAGVTAAPAVRLLDGSQRRFDTVVVAAGAWSGRLLGTVGADAGLRTKRIQYNVHPVCPAGLGAFVDETSGLYGRPCRDGSLLIGLASEQWDIDPYAIVPDRMLARRVAVTAARRLDVGDTGPVRTVASFDCYAEPPGLTLRPTGPGSGLFSFTGGSGGAAKTVLAASRRAAADLLQLTPTG